MTRQGRQNFGLTTNEDLMLSVAFVQKITNGAIIIVCFKAMMIMVVHCFHSINAVAVRFINTNSYMYSLIVSLYCAPAHNTVMFTQGTINHGCSVSV